MAAGEVDDREAAVAEEDARGLIDEIAFAIRAAMSERRGHAREVGTRPAPDEAADAAHRSNGPDRS